MEIVKSIRDLITSDVTIAASVSDRVYAGYLPQEAARTCIMFEIQGANPTETKTRPTPVKEYHLGISALCEDLLDGVAMANVIETMFDSSIRGTVVGVAFAGSKWNSTEGPLYSDERSMFLCTVRVTCRVLASAGAVPDYDGSDLPVLYASDEAAASGGIAIGGVYYLSEDNIWGMPKGNIKIRVS